MCPPEPKQPSVTDTTARTRLKAPWSSINVLQAGILLSCVGTTFLWFLRPILIPHVEFLPDLGASWYYWKLPHRTTLGRITAWGGYGLHQAVTWGTIYYAQCNRMETLQREKNDTLHRVNVFALTSHVVFILLHFVQTAVWYDGLAQDVSIWSSLSSVALILIAILLMENPRRGLFFGSKIGGTKRNTTTVVSEATRILRKYHGYLFSWGVIYTFWYHPMEATGAHLFGFFYTFLLLLQGSLFGTRAHTQPYWTLLLEVFVVFHGTVASRQTNDQWPMFAFGFAAVFIITQMFGLGWSKPLRVACMFVYALSVIFVYRQRGWHKIHEIFRIPMIDYLFVYVVAWLIWLVSRSWKVAVDTATHKVLPLNPYKE